MMKAERGGREGQRFGNYRLVRLLGHGGFADVYLGEHSYLKTSAAIKLLQAKVVSKDASEGFLKEAQTIAHLHHPHIVRILDFGVEKRTPFLVMDYAPQGTVRQRHPSGTQLPLSTLLPYVRQVADALQHAHQEKVIHRDIKPENMLVGRRDEVLLSDFGIALATASSRYLSTQEIVGTAAYMAPEQIQGQPVPASDQYALAVVVYEWLSGKLPFHGTFQELCTQHLFVPPPPLASISPDIERVVMKALAKEPQQRFVNIQAFADALEEATHVHTASLRVPVQQRSQLLSPTAPVAPEAQTIPPTQKVTPGIVSPSRPGGSLLSQLWKTEKAPHSSASRQPLPLRKSLRYAWNAGAIAGISSVLLHVVSVLLNGVTLHRAGAEIAANRLTVNTALALLAAQGINFFIALLICLLAGFVVGKMTARRVPGFLTGAIAGAILYVLLFCISFVSFYPESPSVGGAGIGRGGIFLSLVFLAIWSIVGGCISLLGSWLATRKHS